MLTLGLDTALKSCSVAIIADGATRAARRLSLEKGHAEHLPLMAFEALEAAGVKVRDLDRVGVVVGPGGFAGVRVGVAFARGLALGTKLKTVGVTSLEALAVGAGAPGGLIAAAIDARRGQVYAALYGPPEGALGAGFGGVVVPPFVATPEAALRLLLAAGGDGATIAGDGAALIDPDKEHFRRSGAGDDIDAALVARLAAAAPEPTAPAAPLYLRPLDARPSAPSAFAALLMKEGDR